MTGFAGLLSAHPLDRASTGILLTEMARDITYATGDSADVWMDHRLAVTRVHHGLLNPEPQPISNEDGTVFVVMAGEVFDYDRQRRSLENRGHRFRFDRNDAEHCLHLYEAFGADAFAKLNGSFALMIYDRIQRQLLLVNDRFTSHPLFYCQSQDGLAFGTQLRPLLRWEGLPRQLDFQAVYGFFALRRFLANRTYYQDIRTLPPAGVLRWQDGRILVSRYWQPEHGDQSRSADEYAEMLARILERAVERRTRGDHRLGILLSGGLDSRSIVACCDKPLTAFTLGDFENREVRIARKIAESAGCEHVLLRRDPDHYPDAVSEAVDIGDGRFTVDHSHVLGLMHEVQVHSDVLLDAFGFDVRFKGAYFIHRSRSVFGRTFHTPRLAEVSTLDTLESWRRVRYRYFAREARELFRPECRDTLEDATVSLLRDACRAGPKGHLQDLLEYTLGHAFQSLGPYLMVLATRAKVPQRSIIFDNDLLDVSLALPAGLRARGKVLKSAMRRLSTRLAAIPDANTGLRADLPVWPEWCLVASRIALQEAGVLPRPRLAHPAHSEGSWPNRRELIRHNESLRALIENTLHDPRCLDPDLFCPETAVDLFRMHLAGEADFTRLLFSLLTFGQWHRRYGPP
jgi:asparagine synthase (glutamine-hydrolysing)